VQRSPGKRRPELAGDVSKRDIGGRMFKLGKSLGQGMQDEIAEAISRHLNAFTWSASDMPGIHPDFLCHRLTMDPSDQACLLEKEKIQ